MTNSDLLKSTVDHAGNAIYNYSKMAEAADRIEGGSIHIGDLITVIWNGLQFVVSAVRAGEGLLEILARLWRTLTTVPAPVATPIPAAYYMNQRQAVSLPRYGFGY